MNIIRIDREWQSRVLADPITYSQKSSLLNNYALKDFRLESPFSDPVDFWLDDLDLGDYGKQSAIFMATPSSSETWAVLCSETKVAGNFYNARLVVVKKGTETIVTKMEDAEFFLATYWFLVNRAILKKYKTVIKMGKRRHQIQEMGEKRASSYNQKPIKIADGISYVWEYENPRSFNRHCEAWGVRGHYRHYKNGKVVFIHPYIKGSGRLKDSLFEI